MSKRDLKTMAEELEKMLTSIPEIEEISCPVSESYFLAAEPEPTPEQKAIDENAALLPELVRSIIEYAITRAPNTASARHIGEAISSGVTTAVDKLGLDDAAVTEAVDSFLNELREAVRSELTAG